MHIVGKPYKHITVGFAELDEMRSRLAAYILIFFARFRSAPSVLTVGKCENFDFFILGYLFTSDSVDRQVDYLADLD